MTASVRSSSRTHHALGRSGTLKDGRRRRTTPEGGLDREGAGGVRGSGDARGTEGDTGERHGDEEERELKLRRGRMAYAKEGRQGGWLSTRAGEGSARLGENQVFLTKVDPRLWPPARAPVEQASSFDQALKHSK